MYGSATSVTEIPMPRDDKSYKILTRHNPDFLGSLDDGRVRTLGGTRSMRYVRADRVAGFASQMLLVGIARPG